MTTWNSITIENPGALTLDTLPAALTEDAEIWGDRSQDDERVTIPEHEPYPWSPGYKLSERPGDPAGNITIEGRSKWRPEAAIEALIELSKTTGRVTHYQEWDDDEQGQESAVYEDGEYVVTASRVSDMVPANLHELIAAARVPLARYDAIDSDDDPGYHARVDAAFDLITHARRLIDALDSYKGVAA